MAQTAQQRLEFTRHFRLIRETCWSEQVGPVPEFDCAVPEWAPPKVEELAEIDLGEECAPRSIAILVLNTCCV